MRKRAAKLGSNSTSVPDVAPVLNVRETVASTFATRVAGLSAGVSPSLGSRGLELHPLPAALAGTKGNDDYPKGGVVGVRRGSILKASADHVIVPGVSRDVSRVVSPSRVLVPELVRTEDDVGEDEPAGVKGDEPVPPYVGSPDGRDEL